jgi:hypothetical protein
MRLFLDTEFNGFNGELMSLALVPEDEYIEDFYCELVFTGQLHPWVRDNVVPHMFLLPARRSEFQKMLAMYLFKVGPDITIVADWPDDIRYFCESLITGPGERLGFIPNIKFELDFGISYTSQVPHNALWDARGIREFYKNRGKK